MQTNLNNRLRDPLRAGKGIFYLRTLLLVFIFSLSGKVVAQAKLEVEEQKKDFGSVKRGTVLEHIYVITNPGKEPLILTNAEVACSCTSVDFPRHPILPGEKERIRVTFDTKTVYGRQDRIVLLHSNAQDTPHKLRFKANVSKQ